MLAQDIMTRRVFTLAPHLTLNEAAQMFMERRIGGAPLVDAQGKLVGVLSKTDLVRRSRETEAEGGAAYNTENDAWLEKRGYELKDPDLTRVSDVMTPVVVSAEPGATVQELARLMLKRRLHRIVIVERGRLVGLVTATDMLRALLSLAPSRRCHAGRP